MIKFTKHETAVYKWLSIFNKKDNNNINESTWAIFALSRFFLSIIVLIGHLTVFAPLNSFFFYIKILGARAAVLGFLLISGISIGYSYKKERSGYFSRRFLRIYPLYFFAVLLTVYLQWLLGSPYHVYNQTMVAAGPFTSIANFLFLQNFASITITYNGPLWTLSAEVFFYLLVPIIFRISLIGIQFILALLMLVFIFSNTNQSIYGWPALIYAWPWLLGFLCIKGQSIGHTIIFLIVGLISVVFSRQIIEQHEPLSALTFLFASIVIIFCLNASIEIPKYIILIFNYLGNISYPLYLFHFPLYLLLYHLGLRNALYFPIAVFIVIIPINYIFDDYLKKLFWKPMVLFINSKFTLSQNTNFSKK